MAEEAERQLTSPKAGEGIVGGPAYPNSISRPEVSVRELSISLGVLLPFCYHTTPKHHEKPAIKLNKGELSIALFPRSWQEWRGVTPQPGAGS